MEPEEKLVFPSLCQIFNCELVHEVNGYKTIPDFCTPNRDVAIEVRRLNKAIVVDRKSVAIEQKYTPLYQSLEKIFDSYQAKFEGASFFVRVKINHPHGNKNHREGELTKFLDELDSLDKAKSLVGSYSKITETMSIRLSNCSTFNGEAKLFLGGVMDTDFSGWSEFDLHQSLQAWIDEKSVKAQRCLNDFAEWWLVLVDIDFYGVAGEDLSALKSQIDKKIFSKVIIANRHTGIFEIEI